MTDGDNMTTKTAMLLGLLLMSAMASTSALAQNPAQSLPPPPPDREYREPAPQPPPRWSRQDEELRRGLDKAHRVIEMLGAIIHEIERKD
jgi:hypothetical protein